MSTADWIVATTDARTLPANEILTGRGFVTGKSGSGKSVLEGTPVYTENGRKPIEDVARGERVLSLNRRTYEQEFREVNATIEHRADNLLRITLEDGTELVGTEDHSFLTVEDLEIVPVRGDELEEGTWMPLSRSLPATETQDAIDLAEYAPDRNNVVVTDESIRSNQREEARFFDLTFDNGKVVGLYLAEGSFDSGRTLQISNVDDGVRAFLGEQGFNVYDRTCNKGFIPFAEFLSLEFGAGSAGKSLPNWVFDSPSEFKRGLISGYFDGDGTVSGDSATAMSKSPELLAAIKELLRHFGVSSTIREKFTIYEGETRTYTRLTVDAFCLDTFSAVVDLSAAEKRDRLDSAAAAVADGGRYNSKDMVPNFGPVLNAAARENEWTTRASESRGQAASVHNLTRKQKVGRRTYRRLLDELDVGGRARQFGDSDVQWKRVASVEPLEAERTVYDLDVAVNDNFIANGVFVHNSNTASVIVEELLDAGASILVVDTEGEHYGLKEQYEVLHVGADDRCDVQVGPEDAERIAGIALEKEYPVVLDVSGYFDVEDAKDLIEQVVAEIFTREKDLRKPFLMLVEEIQEYLPQKGGKDDLSKLLLRVAKRGRKRGLGLCGLSQRPSAVDKDFITQCDWMVWHRLTWETDIDVVRRIMGSDVADNIADLEAGEAYLMTDWDDEVDHVKFRRKKTFDAGVTPGMDEEYEEPEFKPVSPELVEILEGERDLSQVSAYQGTAGGNGAGSTATAAEGAAGTAPDGDPEGEWEAPDLSEDSAPTSASGEVAAVDADASAEDLPEDVQALQTEVAQLRRRNEMLKSEVTELKSILANAGEPDRPTRAASEEEATGDASAGATEGAAAGDGDGDVAGEGIDGDVAGAGPPPGADPGSGESRRSYTREYVEAPPSDDSVNVLVEFGQMITYIFASIGRGVRRLGSTATSKVNGGAGSDGGADAPADDIEIAAGVALADDDEPATDSSRQFSEPWSTILLVLLLAVALTTAAMVYWFV